MLFRLCCDNEDIIKDKIQFILQETKKLKMLKGTMPWLSPNEESTHLHETSSRSETEVSDMPTISAIPQTIIDQPIITKNVRRMRKQKKLFKFKFKFKFKNIFFLSLLG